MLLLPASTGLLPHAKNSQLAHSMSRREAQFAHVETDLTDSAPRARSLCGVASSRLALIFAWCVTLCLTTLAALRIFYHDGTHVLIWLNAFTRYVYVPAYVCLAFALWKRQWTLSVFSLFIIGCHWMWLAPDFVRDRRFDGKTSAFASSENASNHIRIFFMNVRASNLEFEPMLKEIEAANPDVIVGVEFTWPWRQAFRHAGITEKYPHNNSQKMGEIDRTFYYSRLPVQREAEERIAGRVCALLNISVGTGSLNIVGLHSPRPTSWGIGDYDVFWERTLRLIDETPHPLVVVGDFNATQYSSIYQKLKESGLRNAHDVLGRGYVTTWPNWAEPVPPIRIDQAFLSPEVNCVEISEGQGHGSDHKPLILDVQVPARGPM